MSDLGKVVQKLTETNLRLETLEKQNIESGTAASIIAQSLPEVLSDRNIAKNRESFDRKEGITGTDDDVRDNTKKLGKKIDKLNMKPKKDDDPNFIGPPIAPPNTGSDEEDETDRQKALKKVFNPFTKAFDKVSKSITGFIGGMASTVKGGAELFLKGIITASVLGLIIKFLQSDYFKDFLSEENLMKLADFFRNIGTYMNQLFDYLADSTNPSSIAYAIAIGAGLFLAGGLISKIIGGVKGTVKFLRALGTLFGIGGALSATSTATAATSATAVKGLGIAGLLKGLGIAALIAALVKGTYEGITSAQDSYMKGNSFGKVVADGVASAVTLGFFPNAEKRISEFLSPSDDSKIKGQEKTIKFLKDYIENEENTELLRGKAKEELKFAEEKLKKLKEDKVLNDEDRNNNKTLRENEADYQKRRKEFIAKGLKGDKLLGKNMTREQKQAAKLLTVDQYGGNFAERKFGKIFDEKEGGSPADIIENKQKQISTMASAMEIAGEKRKNIEDKQKMLDLLEKRKQKDVELLGGRTNTLNSGATINNTSIVNQSDNSITENKNSGAKPVLPFLNPKYIDSF